MIDSARTFKTAEERWAGIGPYYAMFPVSFANRVIRNFSNEGDVVLDPFAGRGTSVYSASTQGRIGVGIELNPVGWVYTKAKISPSTKDEVIHRLQQIDALSGHFRAESDKLPEFFHLCFSPKVRQFLPSSKENLKLASMSSRLDDCCHFNGLPSRKAKSGVIESNASNEVAITILCRTLVEER